MAKKTKKITGGAKTPKVKKKKGRPVIKGNNSPNGKKRPTLGDFRDRNLKGGKTKIKKIKKKKSRSSCDAVSQASAIGEKESRKEISQYLSPQDTTVEIENNISVEEAQGEGGKKSQLGTRKSLEDDTINKERMKTGTRGSLDDDTKFLTRESETVPLDEGMERISEISSLPSTSPPSPPPTTSSLRLPVQTFGKGRFKITNDELRSCLDQGMKIVEIATAYNMNRRSLTKRIRKLEQDSLDQVLQSVTAAGAPVLNVAEQISFLNRATIDILRDSNTGANTKLSAIKRAEQQNELQVRMQQILLNVQETQEFQRVIVETIRELDVTYPGLREVFVKRLRVLKELKGVVKK